MARLRHEFAKNVKKLRVVALVHMVGIPESRHPYALPVAMMPELGVGRRING